MYFFEPFPERDNYFLLTAVGVSRFSFDQAQEEFYPVEIKNMLEPAGYAI
jgi:hypothetical protein